MEPETKRGVKRGRREPYTLVACSLCKARKAKCDGDMPCELCVKRKVVCSYTRRDSSRRQLPAELADPGKANDLSDGGYDADLPADTSTPVPTGMPLTVTETSSSLAQVPRDGAQSSTDQVIRWDPKYLSPSSSTNFAHTLRVARASLEAEGVVQPEAQESRRSLERQPRLNGIYSPLGDLEHSGRPVLDLGYDKAHKALTDFAETIYPLYPCVEIAAVSKHLSLIFLSTAEQGTNQMADSEACDSRALSLMDMDILKAVLGISLLINYDDKSPMARHLFLYLDWSLERFVMSKACRPQDIVIVMLLSIYSFYDSNIVTAWRLVGLAARSCFELGLHQHPAARSNASNNDAFLRRLFCCVYVWDHRLAFATGLPYTMHDKEIDESRRQAVPHAPFLSIMIDYDRISSEVFALTTETQDSRTRDYLDYQLLGLRNRYNALGAEMDRTSIGDSQQVTRSFNTLGTLLSIRTNHARTLLRLPQLQNAPWIGAHSESARLASDCACETVSLCLKLVRDGVMWKSIRSTCDFFVFSALATILLVVSKDPQQYGGRCKQSFHEAIDFLEASEFRVFSPGAISFTLDQLRNIGGRINMPWESNLPAGSQATAGQSVAKSTTPMPYNFDFIDLGDDLFDFFSLSENLGANNGFAS